MPTAATDIVTGVVRLTYLNVFQPRAMQEDQEPKYSACLLIPKTDKKTVQTIKNACEAARLASAALFNGKVPEKLKLPIHDGDGEMPNGGEYGPECKGMYVLNASARQQPGLVDRQCNPILDQTALYSGCWGRVNLNFFAYNTHGNKGIGAGLNHIQKVRDDEALSGRRRVEDVFTPFEDEDNDDADLGL